MFFAFQVNLAPFFNLYSSLKESMTCPLILRTFSWRSCENGLSIIECDKNYFRPTEVDTLLGDSSKARRILNWKPKVDIHELITEMINFRLPYISVYTF